MKRRILSIDGGGIKGVFPLAFLAALEDMLGDRINNYFDLIVGTSTGGIVALGLGMGWSARDLLGFYEEMGQTVFKRSIIRRLPLGDRLPHLFLSKYKEAPLKKALESRFGGHRLGDSTKRLVIPSLNLENGEVHLYKTAHHERLRQDYLVPAVQVALATAAAPTYFPAHRSIDGIPLVDGGLWANNPIAVAAVEALTILEWPRDSVHVLSLSCTTAPINIKHGRTFGLGISYWAFKMVDLFMAAQCSSALGMAQHLLGKERVVRVDARVPGNRFSLDGIAEIESLKGLGAYQARHLFDALSPSFFSQHAEPFHPVYQPDVSMYTADHYAA